MQQKIELLKSGKASFITLIQAKKYLRVDHSYDDEMISEMLDIACVTAENYMGIKLKEASWKITIYGGLPSKIRLIHGPINKIEHFKIYRADDEMSYLSNDCYVIDQNNEFLYMRRSYIAEKCEIIYSTGYSQEQFPSPIKHGMLEHLAKLYDFRGGDQDLPLAAKSLYQPYKKMRF